MVVDVAEDRAAPVHAGRRFEIKEPRQDATET